MSLERLDQAAIHALRESENIEFARTHLRSLELRERGRASMPNGVPMSWMTGLYEHPTIFPDTGVGAWFTDVDGHRYLDMNQVDIAGFLGFAPEPVTRALTDRASRGSSYLLPTEDAIAATQNLAERVGLPFWQFTGAASNSNAELIRLARVYTGRDRVLMFEGKYHGDVVDVLGRVDGDGPRADTPGMASNASRGEVTIPFNDMASLEAALAAGDIACVLSEPMLTNFNIIFPDDDFWPRAQALIREAGALLFFDEAHTHSFAYGGLVNLWGLKPDAVTVGKGLGSGVPFAAYGMSADLAEVYEANSRPPSPIEDGSAAITTGGTTYASALIMAVARAALEECLSAEQYARVDALGIRLAEGLEAIFARRSLNWRAPLIGGRSGWVLGPELPRNTVDSAATMDIFFSNTRRVFMANRGIWEALDTAGPACSFAHTEADVDRYLEVSEEFVVRTTTPA
ncbi:MAG: aspartate aminotransferase family protein [Rhodospirillaceae bacterium]|nr:aspartate aminotransferase family protein [Rhodospirillaceae bacterium]|tara:strand:- start:3573 stop:4946 length:1374 start_codon:yes stop_codon:yes gene_type:complete